MSYSFNWECTLPISNIEDIVSINIVPQTKAYDEGDYLSLRGQVLIDGEYTTNHNTQETFVEYIPIDITLPNHGVSHEIRTDITNFDYEVKDGDKLALTLNLSLDGYNWENPITLVEEEEACETQAQAPVMFTKEAALTSVGNEDVTEAAPALEASVQKIEVETGLEEIEVDEMVLENDDDSLDYIDFDEVVFDHEEVAIDPKLAEERKEALTDKVKNFVHKQPVAVQEPVVEEKSVAKAQVHEQKEVETAKVKPVVEKVMDTVKETVKEVAPAVLEEVVGVGTAKVIEDVAPVVEEVVEDVVKKVKTKPVPPIPTVSKTHDKVETSVEADEEILPFAFKSEQKVDTLKPMVETEQMDMFDMLYALDQLEPTVEQVEQTPVVDQTEVVEETLVDSTSECVDEKTPVEEAKVKTTSSMPTLEDSVANQFLDGESILKVIFVQEEETTITNICTKYDVPEKAIYNLEQLNSPLRCGDRVMINYGKLR
ncbi:MAG: hypothetical protein K2G70_06945 [Turicibacter sp.]|nr:hypothetical protein [Turicibacter sp.]